VAALNNEEIENLRRIGFPENKLHYLPNAVDTQMFYPIKKKIASNYLCMDHTNCYVTYIGRVVGVKNVPVLVKAFSEVVDKIPKAKLLIVGGGDQDEIDRVKKTIRDEQINTKVNILGQLSHEQMVYYYNISDIIVSPSSSEGVSMTVLEAAVCKTPFIGTMVHDSGTIFTNSHNCSLVDSINPDTISNEIMKVIQNEEYAEKIKQNAYDDVISEYSVKSILKKVNEVYTDTISS
jgi:glycosyltransferase involved in cell wall biosynthesis